MVGLARQPAVQEWKWQGIAGFNEGGMDLCNVSKLNFLLTRHFQSCLISFGSTGQKGVLGPWAGWIQPGNKTVPARNQQLTHHQLLILFAEMAARSRRTEIKEVQAPDGVHINW